MALYRKGVDPAGVTAPPPARKEPPWADSGMFAVCGNPGGGGGGACSPMQSDQGRTSCFKLALRWYQVHPSPRDARLPPPGRPYLPPSRVPGLVCT